MKPCILPSLPRSPTIKSLRFELYKKRNTSTEFCDDGGALGSVNVLNNASAYLADNAIYIDEVNKSDELVLVELAFIVSFYFIGSYLH